MIRHAAVAGRFYPAQPKELLREVEGFLLKIDEKKKILGCVVPHAGYMYSGHVAGAVYSQIELTKMFIILCPNHTGMGSPLSIMASGEWETPLGKVRIDEALAARVMKHCHLVADDPAAHLAEHSLEVQLPFLQHLRGEFTFVPIAVGTGSLAPLERLGDALAKTVAESPEKILIIASSDMNHYETDSITRVKDRKAIDKILALDPQGLYQVIKRENVTMCGYGPTVAMLTAVKQLGASRAELIRYATSGDVSGDRDEVVGYAGLVVY